MSLPRRASILALALTIPGLALAAKGKRKSADGLPDFPKEPPEQQAAKLWQAGTLSASRGDYGWAVKQFQSCLKVQPKNDECKDGLKDAKQKLGWNPRPKKKRRPAPKPAEQAAPAEAPAASTATAAATAEAQPAPAAPAAENK